MLTIRKLGAWWFLATSILLNSGCYVLSQAVHQGNLLATRRPVAEVISDPKIEQRIKDQLAEVRRIISFAEQKGLNANGSYERYIEIGNRPVSHLLQAAEATRFKSITWWFPFVGTVPYLGFFDQNDRDEQAKALRDQGYDVFESSVGAFSGLGWFEDPIFSSMLNFKFRADLANLFFHELTHRTIWLPGKVKLNETFAEFVGNELTKQYLLDQGATLEYQEFSKGLASEEKFVTWVLELKSKLSKLYERPEKGREEIVKAKAEIIRSHVETADGKLGPRREEWIKKRTWNNASILAISLYQEDLPLFAKAYECLADRRISSLIQALRDIEEKDLNVQSVVNKLCSVGSPNVDR